MIFPWEAAGVDGRHRYEARLHALEQAILALGGSEFPTLRHVGLARVEDALGHAGLMATVGLAPPPDDQGAFDGFRLSRTVNQLAALHGIPEHVQLRTLIDEDFVRLAEGTRSERPPRPRRPERRKRVEPRKRHDPRKRQGGRGGP